MGANRIPRDKFLDWIADEQAAALEQGEAKAQSTAVEQTALPDEHNIALDVPAVAATSPQTIESLKRLGQAIMTAHPPELWLSYAKSQVEILRLPVEIEQQFLQWIAGEQAAALRQKGVHDAVTAHRPANKFDERIAVLQTDRARLEEQLKLLAAEVDAQPDEPEVDVDRAVERIISGLTTYNERFIEAIKAWPSESNRVEDLHRLRGLPTPAGLGLPLHATNELALEEMHEWRKLQRIIDNNEWWIGTAELAVRVADWTATAVGVLLTAGVVVAVKEGGKRVLIKLAAATAAGMVIEGAAENVARRAGASDEVIAGAQIAAAMVSYVILKRRSGGSLARVRKHAGERVMDSPTPPSRSPTKAISEGSASSSDVTPPSNAGGLPESPSAAIPYPASAAKPTSDHSSTVTTPKGSPSAALPELPTEKSPVQVPATRGATEPSRALVPKAPVDLGNWGEARLAHDLGNQGIKPSSPFATSTGKRYVDRLVNGVAHEAKAGINVGLNSTTRAQALKDAELVAKGRIDGAHWHFYQGAQQELLDFLTELGIKYTVH